MEFTSPVALTNEQAALMARGLYALSRVDGHDEREGLLVRGFWLEAVGSEDPRDLKALEAAGEPGSEELARGLPTRELQELFLKGAWLLAYADGAVSPAERTWIERSAEALGVGAAELARLDEKARAYLLSHLTHLADTEATARVARKLGY
jgi:hypothetical protein